LGLLHRQGASFETAALQPPQDDGFFFICHETISS